MKILTISPNKISDEKKNENIKRENQYYFLENRYLQFLICLNFIKNIDIFSELIKILLRKKIFLWGFIPYYYVLHQELSLICTVLIYQRI